MINAFYGFKEETRHLWIATSLEALWNQVTASCCEGRSLSVRAEAFSPTDIIHLKEVWAVALPEKDFWPLKEERKERRKKDR